MMRRCLMTLISLYTLCISPFTGPHCRFHPTCAAYAREAVQKHGAWVGLILSLRRLLRCHPWSKSPFHDPVPPMD